MIVGYIVPYNDNVQCTTYNGMFDDIVRHFVILSFYYCGHSSFCILEVESR